VKFTRLELLHWDIQANQVLVLQPGVNLITGENGSGKTSILDAIKVVLGGTRIGGDRSVDDYLSAQASPWVMIRLVADNRPPEGSKIRPFDRVQPSEADHFTLAVVYEAGEEGYQPRWYFCPSDVSPLVRGFEGRAFVRKSDYTARLEKLGMGRSFRKLLCTPQGQVAALCGNDPDELFDLLFDFIGGKEVLLEWEALRRDFDKQQRTRDERARVLGDRQSELDRLRDRLRSHERYRGQLQRLRMARAALPVAAVREATARCRELEEERSALQTRERSARTEAQRARAELETLRRQESELRKQVRAGQAVGEQLAARHDTLVREQEEARAEHRRLEKLRCSVADLPERELDRLQAARTRVEDAQADLRQRVRVLREAQGRLEVELARLDEGLLTPPQEVDPFRAVLRKHDVPHQLLMDLIEPLDSEGSVLHALESYLGNFRFAVAVPDLPSFARATALAREHRFPFYVLAPDVRSPSPTSGEHPFLARIRVQDPKYRGLVTRVLRGVRWLEGPIETTLRERGAVLVDEEGYVLDRKGGRSQATDRFFLGRGALERRREELQTELRELAERGDGLGAEQQEQERVRARLTVEIEQETDRRHWLGSEAEHRRLGQLIARATSELDELAKERGRHQAGQDAVQARLNETGKQVAREEEKERRAEQEGQGHGAELDKLAQRLQAAQRALAAATGKLPTEASEQIRELALERSVSFLEQRIQDDSSGLSGFTDAEKDENLPHNVATLHKQVEAVRGELDRLAEQVDEAKQAAERAHEQYKAATKRVFRRYFALLQQAGQPLGFRIEGSPRPRDDGRFAVDLQVGVGDKSPVSYSSPSLSGGQKAALSMLMAMTTLRVHDDDGGPGFFLVDEPFSASDTHKIQELGTFLASTGAQYLVSMPTTEELRRCGSWLEAVLTCTQTPGGREADGTLRLAPPVRCSYVVDRVD
jgi:chromosome segregation protein